MPTQSAPGSTGFVTAPSAPGQLGAPIEAARLLSYLTELAAWCRSRRLELDALDQAIQASASGAKLTADITLSMALWQAVSARMLELERVWDSGRVTEVERRQLADLIWGRLDAEGARGLAVSVPEACRLSDALAAQLRLHTGLDPLAAGLAERIRSLTATVERVRDLIGPAASQVLPGLLSRLADIRARAERGADVGGLLPGLEAEASRAERDLIISGAQQREFAQTFQAARTLLAELQVRGVRVAGLADLCVAQVVPAPKLGIPRVQALGEIPTEPTQVADFIARLRQVEQALAAAEQAYSAPLAERAELEARLDLFAQQAKSDAPEVLGLHQLARAVLAEVPLPLVRARAVVAAFVTLVTPVPSPMSVSRLPKTPVSGLNPVEHP